MEQLISFRGQKFIDCAEVRFHIKNIELADKWMAEDASELPGSLTHEKIAKDQIENEVALIDYLRFHA